MYPCSHPLRHVPFTWWHCLRSLQRPQSIWQPSPYFPSWHSVNCTKMYIITNLDEKNEKWKKLNCMSRADNLRAPIKTTRKNQLKVRFILCKKELDQSAWWEVTKWNWLVYALYMYNIIVKYIKISTKALFIRLVPYPRVYEWMCQFTFVCNNSQTKQNLTET